MTPTDPLKEALAWAESDRTFNTNHHTAVLAAAVRQRDEEIAAFRSHDRCGAGFRSRIKTLEAELASEKRALARSQACGKEHLEYTKKMVKERDLALSQLREAREALEKNTTLGYPSDIDDGSCYFCGEGIKPDDGMDDVEHLDNPKGHKPDCTWRTARELLSHPPQSKSAKDAKGEAK